MVANYPAANWDDVGSYKVELKVSLKDYPTVTTTLPLEVRVFYPCGDLKDNYPNGFWVDKLISDVFVFINGPEQSFNSNFMLMRNEHVKFLDLSISKTQDQLLCGDRHTVLEACDGEK